MKNIAVILSGCGVFDGSEIHEAVLTLLAISNAGAKYHCLAPEIAQRRVVNHLTNVEDISPRSVLVESARIARGVIKDIKQANYDEYDAVIFPGGYGAVLNWSDFAIKGESCVINNDVLSFAQSIKDQGKPIGFICIAPVLISKIYGPGVKLTIGDDKSTIEKISAMGGQHINCIASDIVVDEEYKVVSTPGYMKAHNISELNQGISKLVEKIINW